MPIESAKPSLEKNLLGVVLLLREGRDGFVHGFNKLPRDVTCGLALGALALLLNYCAFLGAFDSLAPLGHTPLYLSAMVFGMRGALLSCALGASPLAFLTPLYAETIYVTSLTLCLAALSQRWQKFPAFLLPVLWSFLTQKLTALIGKGADEIGLFWSSESLLLRGLNDAVVIAGIALALTNPSVWGTLTGRTKTLSALDLTAKTFVFVTIVTLCSAALFLRASGSDLAPQTDSAFAIIALTLALPALAGIRLGQILARDKQWLVEMNALPRSHPMQLFGGGITLHSSARNVRESATSRPDGDQDSRPLLQAPSRAICALGPAGDVIFMNDAFAHICGLISAQSVGRNVGSLLNRSPLGLAMTDLIAKTLERGPTEIEVKLNNLPDKLRFLRLRGSVAYPQAEGGLTEGKSVVVEAEDISSSRSLEIERIEDERKKSLSALVSGMAHAFNNILTLIAGQASFAQRATKAEQETALAEIIRATRDAADLVRHLVEFSEIRRCSPQRVNLHELLTERLPFIRNIVGESFEVHYSTPQLAPIVECDPQLIMQAVSNLLLKAKDSYPHHTGSIWISLDEEVLDEAVSSLHPCARPGKFARLRVRDEGQGMRTDVLAHAFDPTKWASHTAHNGVDLSLATVFTIIRAHDGFLTAESHPEKGTSISIYLSILESAAVSKLDGQNLQPAPENVSMQTQHSEAHTQGILVVEDDETIREVVSAMLKSLGYAVTSSRSADEALELCKSKRFDLVLVDMVMPHMHGLALIDELHRQRPSLPTILMTGSNIVPNDERARAVRVINKPFDIETLARAVEQSLVSLGAGGISATIH